MIEGPIPALDSMLKNIDLFDNKDIFLWFYTKVEKLEKGSYDDKVIIQNLIELFSKNLNKFVSGPNRIT